MPVIDRASAARILRALGPEATWFLKHEVAVATLKKLKELAQSEHLERQAMAQYPVGGHIFEVKDRGAGRFPYVLADNAYRIQFSNPGKKLPMAYVQVSAEYLA